MNPTAEQVAAIKAAATGDDPAALHNALLAFGGQAVDQAKGGEDSAAALKSALEAVKTERTALKTKADEDALQLTAFEELKAKMAEEELKRKAGDAGVDAEAVKKMADRLADEAVAVKIAAYDEARVAKDKKLAKDLENAVDKGSFLEAKYQRALLSSALMAAESGYQPELYPFLMDKAAKFCQPRQEEGGPEWWRSDVPVFDVKDPATGVALPGAEDGKAMTPAELVSQKRTGDWSAFFVQTGRGGGMSSSTGGDTQRTTNTTAAQDLDIMYQASG